MSRKKKWLIGIGLVVVLAALAAANLGLNRPSGTMVNVEKVETRDLESIVSASGKIRPRRQVPVSNEVAGKVVTLFVREGDIVKRGQVLMKLDPTVVETIALNRDASLASAKSQLTQTRAQVDNAKIALAQAQDNLKRGEPQFKAGLMARDAYERLLNDVKTQTTNLKMAEQAVLTQEQRVKVEESNLAQASLDVSKSNVVAPIDGIITQRLIEEGEMARWSTMAGGVDLLVIADLSVIEGEIEVDETDIPYIQIGQPAKVTIDALPDVSFPGRVTEVGNSPIQVTGQQQRATNFKVVVTIDGQVPNVRPGFTCTAIVTTATRQKVVGVPAQAMTLREVIVDEKGQIVPAPTPVPGSSPALRPTVLPELKPGQQRKELDGVFIAKDGHAQFVAVKTGIAGDKYFEVLSGLKPGDEVITGPFASVRNLRDGDEIRVTPAFPMPSPSGSK
jgi:HlyD family secretion protein